MTYGTECAENSVSFFSKRRTPLYAPEFLDQHRAEMLQNFEDLENASSKAALWPLIRKDHV